jgi:hypothetical protein
MWLLSHRAGGRPVGEVGPTSLLARGARETLTPPAHGAIGAVDAWRARWWRMHATARRYGPCWRSSCRSSGAFSRCQPHPRLVQPPACRPRPSPVGLRCRAIGTTRGRQYWIKRPDSRNWSNSLVPNTGQTPWLSAPRSLQRACSFRSARAAPVRRWTPKVRSRYQRAKRTRPTMSTAVVVSEIE